MAAFLLAAQYGRVDEMEVMLRRGESVNSVNEGGSTALHFACGYGKEDAVQFLLKFGADSNAMNRWGNTPLHHAASDGHLGIIVTLLKADVVVDLQNSEMESPLHLAATYDQVEAIQILATRGRADLFKRDGNGNTPLHRAAEEGHLHSVNTLLSLASAMKGDLLCCVNNQARTPIDIAATKGFDEIVEAMQRSGSPPAKTIADAVKIEIEKIGKTAPSSPLPAYESKIPVDTTTTPATVSAAPTGTDTGAVSVGVSGGGSGGSAGPKEKDRSEGTRSVTAAEVNALASQFSGKFGVEISSKSPFVESKDKDISSTVTDSKVATTRSRSDGLKSAGDKGRLSERKNPRSPPSGRPDKLVRELFDVSDVNETISKLPEPTGNASLDILARHQAQLEVLLSRFTLFETETSVGVLSRSSTAATFEALTKTARQILFRQIEETSKYVKRLSTTPHSSSHGTHSPLDDRAPADSGKVAETETIEAATPPPPRLSTTPSSSLRHSRSPPPSRVGTQQTTPNNFTSTDIKLSRDDIADLVRQEVQRHLSGVSGLSVASPLGAAGVPSAMKLPASPRNKESPRKNEHVHFRQPEDGTNSRSNVATRPTDQPSQSSRSAEELTQALARLSETETSTPKNLGDALAKTQSPTPDGASDGNRNVRTDPGTENLSEVPNIPSASSPKSPSKPRSPSVVIQNVPSLNVADKDIRMADLHDGRDSFKGRSLNNGRPNSPEATVEPPTPTDKVAHAERGEVQEDQSNPNLVWTESDKKELALKIFHRVEDALKSSNVLFKAHDRKDELIMGWLADDAPIGCKDGVLASSLTMYLYKKGCLAVEVE